MTTVIADPSPTSVGEGAICTTSVAHVEAVADRHELPVVQAGEYLYCVRQVPRLGQPIIYRALVRTEVVPA